MRKVGHRHKDRLLKSLNEVADDQEDAEELTSTHQAANTSTVGMVTTDESEAQSWVVAVDIGAARHGSIRQDMSVGDTLFMIVSGSVRLVCGPSDVPDYPCEPSSETTLWKHIRQQIEARWQEHRERGGTRRAIEGQCRSDRRSETDHFRDDPERQISSVTFGTDGAHLHRETKGGGKRHGLIRKMRLLSLPTLVLATQVGGSGGLIAPIGVDVLQPEVTHHLGVDLGDMPSAVDDRPDPNGMPAPQEPSGEDIA